MTLRSRLSAAWKAFIRDDFPPLSISHGAIVVEGTISDAQAEQLRRAWESIGREFVDRGGHYPPRPLPPRPAPIAELSRHEVRTPFGSISFDNAEDAAMARAFDDAKRRQVEHDAEIHSALAPTMADEAMKIRAELEDMHSTLTPDNAEPVKLTKRRRKLASVPNK